jgi:energy-coupling factor transporter ATP-binding protein EcfA2
MSTLSGYNPLDFIDVSGTERLEPKGLIILVGPNSSGKTRMLKDIEGCLLGQIKEVVCKRVALKMPLDFAGFLNDLVNEKYIRHQSNNVTPFTSFRGTGAAGRGGFAEADAREAFNSFREDPTNPSNRKYRFFQFFGQMLLTSLFSINGLIAFNEVNAVDILGGPPQNDLHALYANTNAKAKLAQETGKVFGNAAWVDNTRGDNKWRIKVSGQRELPPPEDRLEVEKVQKYRTIEEEGDGYKSYVAVCVALLLGRRPVCLIDEPELHLHPPQAYAIGQFIGTHGRSKEHVTFVATHSSHVLRGIIGAAEEDITVLRLTHIGERFFGHRVSNADLKASTENPRARTELILDGVFSQAVAIVESEGDRIVYQAAREGIEESSIREVHFVPVHGAGGIDKVLKFYRRMRIPAAVIPDYDIIGDYGKVKAIIKELAPATDSPAINELANTVMNAIIRIPPAITEGSARDQLKSLSESIGRWEDKDDDRLRRALEKLRKDLARIRRLKEGGVEGFNEHPTIKEQLKDLIEKARNIGVFFVPVGELENWVGHLMAGVDKEDKASWADIASQRIRQADENNGDVWDFVRSLVKFFEQEQSKLEGIQ